MSSGKQNQATDDKSLTSIEERCCKTVENHQYWISVLFYIQHKRLDRDSSKDSNERRIFCGSKTNKRKTMIKCRNISFCTFDHVYTDTDILA